jgi:hypothetical protein
MQSPKDGITGIATKKTGILEYAGNTYKRQITQTNQ